jgi:hypothetical protein
MEAREKRRLKNEQRWRAAMPPSLQNFALEPSDPFSKPMQGYISIEEMHELVKKELPDTRKRCLALFGWYGSGEGSWSNTWSYEEVPEKLLHMEAIPEAIASAQRDDLTETQLEGAARFFVTPLFKLSQTESQALPAALKKKLLEHSLKSPYADNRKWAQQTFGK